MPRATKSRASKHGQAAQLPSKRAFAVPDGQVSESIIPGKEVAEGGSTTYFPQDRCTDPSPEIGPSEVSFSKLKKGKLPAFTVPDLISPHPYSRSHIKREKRKAKQSLAGGNLAHLSSALSEVIGEPMSPPPQPTTSRGRASAVKPARHAKQKDSGEKGKIGEGKGRTMTENARRKQIALEAKRIPAIMQHPAYKASPWSTIRLHASNSLATVAPVGKDKDKKAEAGAMDLE